MADDAKTMIEVTIGDKTVKIEAGSRLLNQIKNLEEEALEGQFTEARNLFTDSCQKVIDGQMEGLDADALEGMALIYFLDGDGPVDKEGKVTDAVQLVNAPKIIIKARMPKKAVVATEAAA